MVRVITQETFDLVVTENMEEFEMDRAEAVKDAKEQFEQQGVSLVNIVVSEQGSQVRKIFLGQEQLEYLGIALNRFGPDVEWQELIPVMSLSWFGLLGWTCFKM